ncbi:MAG: excinuclease ABC subunit UvrA [Thermoguttaceae bacterium]|jgi:excinuclease ABC subunit A
MSDITIRGARENNLNDVDLSLPSSRLICFTGVSGSGKSSMAFDTLYAEGQRRYIESLSSYARYFIGGAPRPNVDQINGLRPTISIAQKSAGQNQRSTVGTITEIADFFRVLFARVGTGYCPKCGRQIAAQTRSQILEHIKIIPNGAKYRILAPLVRDQKGRNVALINRLRKKGYRQIRVDGHFHTVDDVLNLDHKARHTIDVVIDRIEQSEANYGRLGDALDSAMKMGNSGVVVKIDSLPGVPDRPVIPSVARDEFKFSTPDPDANESASFDREDATPANDVFPSSVNVATGSNDGRVFYVGQELYFSADYACPHCGLSFDRPTPQTFSFNHSRGMCPYCQGLGHVETFDPRLLIPDPGRSFQQGCIVLLHRWRDMGAWSQRIYLNAAHAIEQKFDLPKDSVLETAWEELDERARRALLYGLAGTDGEYAWRSGELGETKNFLFEGVIPRLLNEFNETKDRSRIAKFKQYMNVLPCAYCHGARLNELARSVRIDTRSSSPLFAEKKSMSLPELSELPITDLLEFLSELELTSSAQVIAKDLVKEIRSRLGFLLDVGLGYLAIGRSAPTLSGGEMQRIRLAGQIGGGLVGVLYILDEPSIGLHSRDNGRLIATMSKLRDLGNSVVVVEHDEDTMLAADYLVDFGPGSGSRGGQIVASGPVIDVLEHQRESSLTAKFLVGEESIPVPKKRRAPDDRWLVVRGVEHHNLKNIDVKIPIGRLVCVTGVSGSGKSSFVNDILCKTLAAKLNHAQTTPGKYDSIEGVEYLKKIISIDQSPIGRNPRSNPATYIKLFDEIRKLYAATPESRAKGFTLSRFSFNVRGGRCETCEGNGAKRLDMDFLADVWETCTACGGRRFNQETIAIKHKGLSIDQVLDLDVETAMKHFENIPKIRKMLQTLYDVGLGYMKIGQPSPTLSGGEAQRVKLAKELVKKSSGKTIYVLDEPTTGLHFADIRSLLKVLHSFADSGNTVVVVEHNLDVIKTADWIIDLGPEGGEHGGKIVAEGTPEDVANNPNSWTGRALKAYLTRDLTSMVGQLAKKFAAHEEKRDGKTALDEEGPIVVQGACEHNLQNISIKLPRNKMTVCCGPSGSGKSSFAIDVVYAEGRRRYVESLSCYARQYLGMTPKPKVERTAGISPSISIEQKSSGRSQRSTVGTVTEVLDYLRVVYARLGIPYCPDCNVPIDAQSTDEIIARVHRLAEDSELHVMITAPISLESGETYSKLWERLRAQGFVRIRANGETYLLDEPPLLEPKRINKTEIVVDRLTLDGSSGKHPDKALRSRVSNAVETALEWGKGVMDVVICDDRLPEKDWEVRTMSQILSCEKCGRAFDPLTPRHFSFNSVLGQCPHCEGLGVQIGSNPGQFIRDSKLSLAEGALSTWSDFTNPMTLATLRAFSRGTKVPLDVPFERLDARCRRMIFNGTGANWFDVCAIDLEVARKATTPEERALNSTELLDPKSRESEILFQFQYKGQYPSMEEASKLAPYYRSRLDVQMEESECSACLGSRLCDESAAVQFHSMTIDQVCRTPLGELVGILKNLELTPLEQDVAGYLIDEIIARVQFLVDVGLDYLTLARPAPSLSGGESQRIRLAAQIGSGLVGVLYVLDEPTIGLHTRDNRRLIAALKKLRDLGNTLLVVEHDQEVIESADNIVDFGPRAGRQGGMIVASGTPKEVTTNERSVTGPYLSGKKSIPIPINRRIIP